MLDILETNEASAMDLRTLEGILLIFPALRECTQSLVGHQFRGMNMRITKFYP